MSVVLETCPFLGCTEDRDSVCGYPTAVNVCYALAGDRRTYRGAPLSKQRTRCLAKYHACERYQAELSFLSSGTPVPVTMPLMQRLFHRLIRLLSAR